MVRYNYREGAVLDKKKKHWFLILTSLIFIGFVGYAALIYASPRLVTIPFTGLTADKVSNKIIGSSAGQFGDRLFIPQINVDAAIIKGGDSKALNDGVWQRQTGLGDPAKGGNLALSGSEFVFDFSPWQTRAKSPFCNLDKLQKGNQLTVDYDGKRYIYEVDQINSSGEAEQRTNDARLTLYATDGKGSATSGPIVSAKLLGQASKQ